MLRGGYRIECAAVVVVTMVNAVAVAVVTPDGVVMPPAPADRRASLLNKENFFRGESRCGRDSLLLGVTERLRSVDMVVSDTHTHKFNSLARFWSTVF
jgi:hypothetical protein